MSSSRSQFSYRNADEEGARITMSPVDAATVALDPYPFDVEALRVSLPARRLPQSKFENQDAFRKASFQAPLELLEYELRPAARSARSDRILSGAAAS